MTGSFSKVLLKEKQLHATFQVYSTLKEGYKAETLSGAVLLIKLCFGALLLDRQNLLVKTAHTCSYRYSL